MSRPIVLSNGELHVGINNFGLVHDFYFPYVGFENHAASAGPALRHKVGVWIDGQISWLDEDTDWKFKFSYPHHSLIGHTVASNETLGVVLEFDDCVDTSMSAFLRNVHVINTRPHSREIRLFMHQAFAIGDSLSNTDTAQYLPDSDAILHYRGRRAFVVSGRYNDRPFDQHSIGLFGVEGHEGTYRDAEDGELAAAPVEHGRVDSVLRFKLDLEGHNSARIHYWIAAGVSTREALFVHRQISEDGVDDRLHSTAAWWREWMKPAMEVAENVPDKYRQRFLDSVMVLKSQMDKRGAVIASTDSSMLNYSRDAYGYCWPRDGAYVVWPLIRLGYRDEAYRFFDFCKRGLHPGGYLMHKYRADGALGSSWHPYVHANGDVAPPIQEDETALVVFVFCQFYNSHPDVALLKQFYRSMIVPMADFLASYIDLDTGLPRASYDLWEEVYLTTTYTTAITYAALLAASELAEIAEDAHNAVKWRTAGEDIRAAAHKYLYNHDRKAFYKGIFNDNGQISHNDVIDSSSIFGAFLYGLFDDKSTEMDDAVGALKEAFSITNTNIGAPRYENDNYHREDSNILGNWWYVTTFWLAQYEIASGESSTAEERIDWMLSTLGDTGMMSEQINPKDDTQIAPSPLTWSHAEFLSTVLDLIDHRKGDSE